MQRADRINGCEARASCGGTETPGEEGKKGAMGASVYTLRSPFLDAGVRPEAPSGLVGEGLDLGLWRCRTLGASWTPERENKAELLPS